MTPAARHAAAIEVLDLILAGMASEQALTNWGRAHRFAGSGDRHAIRDLVFDALRCRRSFAALGGAMTGRGLILGALRSQGRDPAEVFTGLAHAPPPVTEAEAGRFPKWAEALDVPDWLLPELQESLGEDMAPVLAALRHRAPVFLRVNLARIGREAVRARLALEGVQCLPDDLASSALRVTAGERRISATAAYQEGLVELQDASSQAVVDRLAIRPGMRVLDYCAGGGGKTLALAARGVEPHAHDAAPARMRDLPARAARAKARVKIVRTPAETGPYDLILVDAPCSGSGSWRRDPQGKWTLTPERLAALVATQAGILDLALGLLAPGGVLAYATCSLLRSENELQLRRFLARHPDVRLIDKHRFSPLTGGDGFFLATLTRQARRFTQLERDFAARPGEFRVRLRAD